MKFTGLPRKKTNEYITNPFFKIPERIARRYEQIKNKPKGRMDEQHIESDPACAAFFDDLR